MLRTGDGWWRGARWGIGRSAVDLDRGTGPRVTGFRTGGQHRSVFSAQFCKTSAASAKESSFMNDDTAMIVEWNASRLARVARAHDERA